MLLPARSLGLPASAGKTTTTTLTGRIAHAAAPVRQRTSRNRKEWVGGNIGSPLIAYVDEMDVQDLAIMELSSFQLEIMNRSPQVAAVLERYTQPPGPACHHASLSGGKSPYSCFSNQR